LGYSILTIKKEEVSMFKDISDVGDKSTTPETMAYCKSSFDPNNKSGKVFVAFDLINGVSCEYMGVFPKVPSNNYLVYLAVSVALKYMLQQNLKGTIFSPLKLVVQQLSGEFRLNTPDFVPFFNFIRENATDGILIEFMPAKEMRFSKSPKKQVDKDIMLKIETLMSDSLCLAVQDKNPLPETLAFEREKKIRRKCDLISGRKYSKRSEYELQLQTLTDEFLSNQEDSNESNSDNNSDEDDEGYNDDDNS